MKVKILWLNILKNLLNVIVVLGIGIGASFATQLLSTVLSEWYYVNVIVSSAFYITMLLVLGSLYAKKVLKLDNAEVGLSFSSLKKTGAKNLFWIAGGIALPILVLAFYFGLVPGAFKVDEAASVPRVLIYAIFQCGLWAGIGEEYMMRGIIFRYMKKTLGTVAAVLIPSVIFALLHISNMDDSTVIDVLQLIVGGTAVAVMFSLLALKTGSLIPGMFFHACWNIMIIGSVFGVGDIVNGVENDAIIQYRLASESHLLTGGNFGIETALPAIAGYIIVCVVLLCLRKKEKTLDK